MPNLKSDAIRRGLRTAIDVVLSAVSSGALLLLVNVFKEPDLTAAQFATLTAALTPVLSAIKNGIEDKAGRSFLVDKTRPEPDPVTSTSPGLVEGQGTTANPDYSELPPPDFGEGFFQPPAREPQQVMLAPMPVDTVLVAVPLDEVDEDDHVVGFVQ